MANGGRLVTPFVPRTAKDEARSTPKVRRIVDIRADSFQQMVPGMIGAVSYGSGRKAANSREVIAGKTGTCIERGAWIGLFTSYAPLNNPRLAVVVIGRGVDGRNHFPAAVAGRIYRDLGARFGAPPVERIAGVIYSPTQPFTTDTAALTADDEESDEAEDEAASRKTPPQKLESMTIWGDRRQPADSKVKRVVMPISNRIEQTQKTSAATDSKSAARPRRATTLRP
jgi:membrane peptidoglycan carboxypeptidase